MFEDLQKFIYLSPLIQDSRRILDNKRGIIEKLGGSTTESSAVVPHFHRNVPSTLSPHDVELLNLVSSNCVSGR